MNINNTGTFYVEGEYAQGDTILTAGDWELRANGSKNAFAYSPETFVRRNLLNWSEDLTNSSWVKNRTVVTQELMQTPIGTTVNKIAATETNSNGYNIRHNNIADSTGVNTSSFLVKKGTHDFALIVILGSSFADGVRQWFNLSNGTLGISNVFGTGYTKSDASITPVGDGWYWISFSANCAQSTNVALIHPTAPSDLGFAVSLNDFGYVAAGQFERGTPSDYQRTTTVVPKPTDGTLTLGNGKHKDFRYYPKTLPTNEVLELVK